MCLTASDFAWLLVVRQSCGEVVFVVEAISCGDAATCRELPNDDAFCLTAGAGCESECFN